MYLLLSLQVLIDKLPFQHVYQRGTAELRKADNRKGPNCLIIRNNVNRLHKSQKRPSESIRITFSKRQLWRKSKNMSTKELGLTLNARTFQKNKKRTFTIYSKARYLKN